VVGLVSADDARREAAGGGGGWLGWCPLTMRAVKRREEEVGGWVGVR
jgi:hypothetical protein